MNVCVVCSCAGRPAAQAQKGGRRQRKNGAAGGGKDGGDRGAKGAKGPKNKNWAQFAALYAALDLGHACIPCPSAAVQGCVQ